VSGMEPDKAENGQDMVRNAKQNTGHDDIIHESSTRVSVYEAADLLGLTVDAVRKRIQRGTIPHERREDGRVYVLLDKTRTPQEESGGPEAGNARETYQDQRQVTYRTDELVESLQDQIEFLRRELERKDEILLRMTERVPEIETVPAPRVSPGAAIGAETGVPVPPESQEAEPERRRSWLYRFFIGPG